MRADILVVDGRHMLYRCADAFRDLSAEVGDETIGTGGMYGFLAVVVRVFRRYGGRVYIAWEGKRSRNFRRTLYDGYKKRGEPDPEMKAFLEDMGKQERRLKAMLRAAGVRQHEGADCEADDVIAWLARTLHPTKRVIIYTGDSDLRQLVDERVIVVSPGFRGQETVYDAAKVEEKHGVPPRLLADLKALAGDTSDGIPGLRGIGPKTAAQLCQTFGGVKAIIQAARAPEGSPWPVAARFKPLVASSARDILLYKKLTTVRADAGVTEIVRKRSREVVMSHFRAYSFHSLLQPSELHDLMTMGLD